ncbi:kinase-like domain-containing protein [Elsinoe ampelina]|uniref:non-specific serine/threonine protein kinase n=1 Tax=Elsinoe ampelina TaxID=302913 RepID=A0A6A6G0F5_9PEZI|nr:kinase-like domain-containing protein [Elsinoe ampelina]
MAEQEVKDQEGQQGVRFASKNEEISPEVSLSPVATLTGERGKEDRELNPEAEEEIKQLKANLQKAVQSQRLEAFSFEPVSLPNSQPVSRVPSGSRLASKVLPAGSLAGTPRPSPPHSAVHSPPLTPASTSRDGRPPTSIPSISLTQRARAQADTVTPQRSSSPDAKSSRSRPSSVSGPGGVVGSQPRPAPRFSIGPSAESGPPSEDPSPAPTPGTQTPSVEKSHRDASSIPSEKSPDDSKRVSPTTTRESREAMFRFGNRDPRHGYSTSSTNVTLGQPTFSSASLSGPGTGSLINNPQSSSGSSINQLKPEDKRMSFFGTAKSEKSEEHHKEKASSSNLKRFFKFGHKKDKDKDKSENGTKTPPNGTIPFADDHGLESKYGKFGKMLGSGAGGSVRLMKRTADGKTFAVKQFRNRHPYESEKEYNKKVTSEFCIGSTLHHGNIIETIDIVHEKGVWYEVMEYCPYDLFATVMTGKMGRDEVTCATLQILSGVMYLHSMGLAHRDLKLDNVVINEHGIMKIIDFGSATVFRYPFENDIVLSTGVVGSDPYLAPEVYDNTRYDPQMADIWSIAIIFCCMCLRRFPWKAPRMTDNSYRLFVSPPDPGQDELLNPSRKSSQPSSRTTTEGSSDTHHHHHHHHEKKEEKPHPTGGEQPTIKGPIRLLRLLPRDTRHIIGRMLELDPKKRATLEEILEDNWVANALVCRQEEGGVCYHAPNHRHHLEGSGQSLVTSKK